MTDSGVDASLYPRTAAGFQYAEDVISGKIPACRWVRLACERHKKDLERQLDPNWPYRFDPDRSEDVLDFIELMPHTKGKWAAKRLLIELEGWQCFFVGSIFGWIHKETGFRRYREARLKVPRKNGKSAMAAGIGNYMLTADNEHGAEVYSGATNRKQALEVFKPAKLMAKKRSDFCQHYGVRIFENSLTTKTDGVFEPLIGDPGDGGSPSCAIVDEYHEHKSDKLYDTMKTGMGAREQPLMLVITTAGTDTSGPCFLSFEELKNVLEGVIEDEDLFGLIYTIDKGDNWTDPAVLRKANPNFGVSASADYLEGEQAKAVRTPRNRARFQTKHLNIWVSAKDAYFDMENWQKQADPDLQIPAGADVVCYGASDMGNKWDLTAHVRVWRAEIDGKAHYYVKSPNFFLPETTAELPEKKAYHQWVDRGFITVTDGNIIDYSRIFDEVEANHSECPYERIGYDSWNATQFAQQVQDELQIEIVEILQRVNFLSEPMKWIQAFLKDGRLHHDGNPVLTWMIGNVVAREDANKNVYPRKPDNEDDKKIDGAVALIMAMALALAPEEESDDGSYLEDDDILFL